MRLSNLLRTYLAPAILLAILACHPHDAQAQSWRTLNCAQGNGNGACHPTQYKDTNGNLQDVSAATPLPVNASVSASVAGFTPNGTNGTAIAATTTSASQALPGGSAVVNFFNDGSNTAYVRLGIGSATATVADIPIPPNSGCALVVGSNTFAGAITATGTANIRQNGGAGLGSFCYGGGGSSSGSGGVVTQPTASNLNATVVGTGTFATQAAQAGTWNVTNVSGTVSLPTGASTAANQSTEITSLGTIATNSGTQATAANQTVVQGVIGAATSPTKMEMIGGVYNSSPITLTNGQSAAMQLDANGYQKVNVVAGGGAGGTSYAQGATVAGANVSPAGCRTLTAAPTDTTAQINMPRCLTDGSVAVTVQNNGVAQGATASGLTISPIGARTLSTTPTDTTAQVNSPVMDLGGATVTRPYALPDVMVSGTTAAMTSTTSTSLLAAPGAGLRNYVTYLTCVNSHATVGTFVTIQDGSGGTALMTLAAAAVFGGHSASLPVPLKQPTANTALFVADVTTGANVICSATGYKAP